MNQEEGPIVWMTKQEAATYLKVHPETVRRNADKGLLKRHGAGKKQRFRRDELDQYLRIHEPWKLP